jgi:hypothetical protein
MGGDQADDAGADDGDFSHSIDLTNESVCAL